MRVLNRISAKRSDVLVLDEEGSQAIVEYCVPKQYSSFVLELRNSVPFILSFSFFLGVLRGIKRSRGNLSISLLFAVVSILKPKVVITFIDNSKFMGALQTLFPDVLVISIQNGARNKKEFAINLDDRYFSFPHYFGFGGNELSAMRSVGANVKKYYSNGSLNMGIFMSHFYRSKSRHCDVKSISFISQYKQSFIDSDNAMYIKFASFQKKLCGLLDRLSQENDVRISIIMRSEIESDIYQNELNFFKSNFSYASVDFCANNRASMSSYQTGMESDLIIAFDSTLLFELFGAGKKILCFSNADREFSEIWSANTPAELTPAEILADDYKYEHFKEKVSALLNLDSDVFFEKTRKAREYYMNFSGGYPHCVLHSAIEAKCSQC